MKRQYHRKVNVDISNGRRIGPACAFENAKVPNIHPTIKL